MLMPKSRGLIDDIFQAVTKEIFFPLIKPETFNQTATFSL